MNNKQQTFSPKVKTVEITDENDGQRLDNFLITYLKGVPKSRIYRIVRKGEVRVNKGRKDVKYRLCAGDLVRIPPVKIAQRDETVFIPAILKQTLNREILFEDESLLIVNKPSGFAVHGGSGIQSGVIEALRDLRQELRFLELVHRLDRDTSGCLIVAKKRSALRNLHEQFRGNGIQKHYLALLAGKWQKKKLLVDKALQKNVSRGGERMVVVSASGKAAETTFKRLQLFPAATLVEASPHTGRTHQIRVHAASMGHPIVGDARYGTADINKEFRERGFKRLFLHAQKLTFQHPVFEQILSVTAPLPPDLAKLIADER